MDDLTIPHAASCAIRWGNMFRRWWRNARTRGQLARMSTHTLNDIGLTQEAARREAARPFWSG
ncbi:hypothetical protein RGUI_0993 [Rhodovulum sp. P5]|uniref:DUF1127 domain-containing protein n=1 Tax=Rhodovulum sp. P5 TaxID=1564506 RepID=UPI0009C3D8DA|nr:DUF1127 domain-containing protein [Rhodovulum sp. P5]ARE39134.1 hypothetical protein RGUI_0993 [Rhodovulum sp. P5]